MFLLRKQLCKAVSRLLSSRLLLNCNSSRVYLLTKLHLVDINIAKLCLDAICVALNKAYSLRIITLESLLSIKCKANITAEAILVLQFNASS
jgi:hypothetical protein